MYSTKVHVHFVLSIINKTNQNIHLKHALHSIGFHGNIDMGDSEIRHSMRKSIIYDK